MAIILPESITTSDDADDDVDDDDVDTDDADYDDAEKADGAHQPGWTAHDLPVSAKALAVVGRALLLVLLVNTRCERFVK